MTIYRPAREITQGALMNLPISSTLWRWFIGSLDKEWPVESEHKPASCLFHCGFCPLFLICVSIGPITSPSAAEVGANYLAKYQNAFLLSISKKNMKLYFWKVLIYIKVGRMLQLIYICLYMYVYVYMSHVHFQLKANLPHSFFLYNLNHIPTIISSYWYMFQCDSLNVEDPFLN